MRWKATVLLLVWIQASLVPLSSAQAQEPAEERAGDLTPPRILHDPPEQTAPAGEPLTIQAVVMDDTEVKEVLLFYRILGNVEYLRIYMTPTEEDLYQATIPAEDVLEPGIEYYIQATDQAGNMVLRGFSFSPLMVNVAPVLPEEPVVEEQPAPVPEEAAPVVEAPPEEEAPLVLKTEEQPRAWYQNWWVWALVGGVVIAAAAAGGGGGDGGEETGSLTLTGPLP